MKHILSFFIFCTLCMHICGKPVQKPAVRDIRFSVKMRIPACSPKNSVFACTCSFFDTLTIRAGNVSAGGLWGDFITPAPAFPQPLAKYTETKPVFTAKTHTKNLLPAALAFECAFPGGKLLFFTEFDGINPKKPPFILSSGAGCIFPFKVRTSHRYFKSDIQLQWTCLWKRTRIEAKHNNTWFYPYPPFASFYTNGIIQELAVKFLQNRFSLTSGIAESPYGKPAYFVKTHTALQFNLLSYTGGAFFCSHRFLKQNGTFETDRIKLFFNPAVTIPVSDSAVKFLRAGTSIGLRYEESGTFPFKKNAWKMSIKTEAALKTDMSVCTLHISYSPVDIYSPQKYGFLTPEFRIDCTYPLFTNVNCRWKGSAACVLDLKSRAVLTKIETTHSAAIALMFSDTVRCKSTVYASCTYTPAKQKSPAFFTHTFKLKVSPTLVFTPKNCRLHTSADTHIECILKNTALQKISGEIVLKLQFDY
ncbi:hypothetical protein H0R92_08860 [Treponema sp. OMZ 840]|uniref:hypothetical protein n=1 Tax=Treponema sp. OMZ 840 TaxID=244313 RepID=UPI003D92A2D5